VGSIRIIAGRFRGRVLRVPDVAGLRPTGNRVREALFNILGQDLAGRAVLDLYAGTGALGLEAVSRGSPRAVFVESDRTLAQGLRRAAEALGVAGSVRVVAGRVEDVLRAGTIRGSFDVVLADPPYGAVEPQALADAVAGADVLSPGGVLVLETGAAKGPLVPPRALRLMRSERYGGTTLLFFKYPNPGSCGEES
jgi:16S rRNA (guanine966-N2)-methyltransferase